VRADLYSISIETIETMVKLTGFLFRYVANDDTQLPERTNGRLALGKKKLTRHAARISSAPDVNSVG
jgi:hypothetical protein